MLVYQRVVDPKKSELPNIIYKSYFRSFHAGENTKKLVNPLWVKIKKKQHEIPKTPTSLGDTVTIDEPRSFKVRNNST